MTVTKDGVRYEPTTLNFLKNADGRATVELFIRNEDMEEMSRLTGSATERRTWIIAAPSESEDVRIRIPMKKLSQAMKEHTQLNIVVRSGTGSYQLPVKQLADLSNGNTSQQLIVHMMKPSAELLKVLTSAASTQPGAHLMAAVQFQLHLEQDGRQEPIPDRAGILTTGSIRLPSSQSARKMTAVKYNAKTKTFSFVPSWMERTEGESNSIMNMKHDYNGIFAVLKYAPSFHDLNGHWAKANMELLASKFIIQGRGNGQFAPNDKVTRAEFTSMLVRALGSGDVQGQKLSKDADAFKDVPASAWYADALATAVQLKLVEGDGNGSFHPNASITREQLAQMLVNAARLTGHHLELSTDFLNGYLDRTLRPNGDATRAEAGVALTRLLLALQYIAE
ncbi:S-layer homology domain-containing protein [Paenibacillus sp. cl6col]|uniref:S-layer homology domain-containing protein n=1 Tax=Paenibacillus sp. cl6col TaxID=1761878 RepID=UPI00088D9037|nr:S-layer homology domain-containing protein [Paenibacillus sp. cl6col]SDG42817.1 S-layer homology domain-containing protein [Paenibacillus sp. cl6col]